MLTDFTGRGLFIFSDPGGAKAILALVHLLKPHLDDFKIVSDRKYKFYSDFSFSVDLPPLNIIDQIDNYKPDFIFTGTSYTSKIELNYLHASKFLGVKCFSFIDHWTFFKKRFEINGRFEFPDKLFVIDNKAKQLAVAEGIDIRKILILENPYYEFIRLWKPELNKSDFMEVLGINNYKRNIVVIAPDPLSNLKQNEAFEFDEYEAINALSKIISHFPEITFILKPHPNQDLEKLKIYTHENMILVGADADANTLMYYSDIVIGFFSNFLIEASFMKRKVLRYHFRPVKNDPLAESMIGNIVDSDQLIQQLQIYGI